MATEQTKAVVHRFHSEVWNEHNLAVLDELVHPDFQPTPTADPNAPRGPQAARNFMVTLFAAFPDLTSSEDDLFAEGDKAALRWTIRGTHQGALWGMPATGNTITLSGMDLLEITDGKIAKDWGGFGDQVPKLMEQLKVKG